MANQCYGWLRGTRYAVIRKTEYCVFLVLLACEQAPGGASAEQTFGAKRRAIGACTHSPKSPMSASKFWTQSGDWWIIIIHDVILVSTSGIDKNQNGAKEKSGSSRGLSAFIKLFEIGARTA